MAAVSGDFIWQIVKKNNAFLVKQFSNSIAKVQFSKEKNNLYNLNSFKHFGLANRKTVSIQPAGEGLAVVLATTKTKKQRKPAKLYHKSVMKKEFSKMAKAVQNQVRQMHLVAPLEKQFPILYGILKDHIAEDVNYKVIVFCTTAMVTRLVADLLSELRLNVREIYSRKPQSYRTRVSKEFKESKGLILVSSDVSARGVDYPDVTLVVQLLMMPYVKKGFGISNTVVMKTFTCVKSRRTSQLMQLLKEMLLDF